jgi:ubiquinone/menaquinone biosynthesis C-methylase UbiE
MRLHRIATTALFALLVCPGETAAQTRTPAGDGAVARAAGASTRRDDWQKVPEIIAALQAKPGSRIADLGAGEGWLTTRLARHVGERGRVFAVDISPASLDQLAQKLQKDTLRNVEIVLAEDDDPRLPFGTLDGVVILNAYHEMTKRVAVLEGVKRSLRPGGLLVIVDNRPADSLRSRQEQTSRHSLAIDFARDDLEAQGFEIVSSTPVFIEHKGTDHPIRQWLLVARRGAK